MTAADSTGGEDATPPGKSRGVAFMGSDVGMSGMSFPLDASGVPILDDVPPLTFTLRTDLWRFWLRGAIDAAVVTAEVADQIPPLYEQVEAGKAKYADVYELCERELIASMQAITSSAFAIDAFYASVKYRSPPHPDQAAWNKNRLAREKQLTETLFYHLRIRDQEVKKQIRNWISPIYQLRDSAVHPPSEFRDPIYRPDINCHVDRPSLTSAVRMR